MIVLLGIAVFVAAFFVRFFFEVPEEVGVVVGSAGWLVDAFAVTAWAEGEAPGGWREGLPQHVCREDNEDQ